MAAPDSKIAQDPDVRAAGYSVVRVLGTACGLGVEGSGWIAAPDLVVTNAHVVAGESDTTVTPAGSDTALDAIPVHYDPENDLSVLRVNGLDGTATLVRTGRTGRHSGSRSRLSRERPVHDCSGAGRAAPGQSSREDSYGRGPVTRELTALRGEVRSGNSGGPWSTVPGRCWAPSSQPPRRASRAATRCRTTWSPMP